MHVFHIALQAISGAIVSLPLFFILPLLNRGGVFRRVMSHLIIIGFVAFVWNLFRMTTFDYMLSASDIWKDFGGWYFTALLVFGLFAALHYIIRAYSEIAVGRTYVETEKLRRVEAENLSREAQIKMLRYQLNPHFLFNTLNSISALIKTDRSAQARTMVSQLSDFLRSSLDKDPHQKVTLSDEVKTLELYLNIEKVRYEERLKTEFNITSKAMKGFIPSLILQPLFENALKYAIAGKIAGGIIRLTSKVEHGNLLITVEDSGARLENDQARPPQKVEVEMGVGLNNIIERLQSHYGHNASLEFYTSKLGGLSVRLTLPYEDELALRAAKARNERANYEH